jgi:CRP/FNR family cyclic AMP-dependent transcriptional regulator
MTMHADTKLELLERVPLFARLRKRELKRIAGMADEIEVPAGLELIVEGERGREFFVLLSGAVIVFQGDTFLDLLGPGSFFGELALLADRPRSATVTTIEPSRVLVLSEHAFRDVFRSSEKLPGRLLPEVARRLAA